MSFVLEPWQLLLMALAGWVNLYQQQRIGFQDEEIQILLRQLGKRRLRFHDDRSLDQGRIGDLLPVVRHGACHPPGSLRRVYSQSRRIAITRGWVIGFWCRAKKWDERRARSPAGNGSVVSCATTTGPQHERSMMLTWLKRRLVAWVERCQQREIQRLHRHGCRLKGELLKLTGEGRIVLSPEEQRRLWEKAKRIDPEVLKQISQFDLEDLRSPSANDTSAESR